MKNRPLAERIALVSLAVLVAAWIIGALVNTPVFFQPVLFGLGTGTIIAALALGLVVAYRASGVINFGHGAIATYVTYVYVSLTDTGDYPIPPIPKTPSTFRPRCRSRGNRCPSSPQSLLRC